MHEKDMTTTRDPWIDLVKCIAILAVLVDHTFGYGARLGRDLCVSWSFFSVSLFVLIGGYNAGRSQERRLDDALFAAVPWRGISRLLLSYLGAALVYHVFRRHSIVFCDYLHEVASFSSVNVFYFVAFYLQLLAVSPVLYRSVRRRPALSLVAVALAAHWLTRHSVVFESAYGAGKCLLGGYYLMTFAIGMAFSLAKPSALLSRSSLSLATGVASLLVAIALGLEPVKDAICAANGKVGFILYSFSPQGGALMLMAIAIFLLVRSGADVVARLAGRWPVRLLLTVGRESMTVYLYHILALIVLDRIFVGNLVTGAVEFCLAAALPTVGVMAYRSVLRWWKGDGHEG